MPQPDAEGNGEEGRDGSEERRERPHVEQALQQEKDGRRGQGQGHGAEESEVGPGDARSSSSSISHQFIHSVKTDCSSSKITYVSVPLGSGNEVRRACSRSSSEGSRAQEGQSRACIGVCLQNVPCSRDGASSIVVHAFV